MLETGKIEQFTGNNRFHLQHLQTGMNIDSIGVHFRLL